MPSASSDRADGVNAARLAVACFLARVCSDPAGPRWERLCDASVQDACVEAAGLLAARVRAPSLGPGESDPRRLDLGPLAAALRAPRAASLAAYDRVFGLVTRRECPPYETEYCPQTFSVHRSQQLADIAGCYAAFGLTPSRERPERPDHVSLELEFLAWLLAKEIHALRAGGPDAAERAELCRRAQRTFVGEHLAWWLPAFARALQRQVDALGASVAGCYLAELPTVLAAWVPVERAVLAIDPPTTLVAPRSTDDGAECLSCTAAEAQTPRGG